MFFGVGHFRGDISSLGPHGLPGGANLRPLRQTWLDKPLASAVTIDLSPWLKRDVRTQPPREDTMPTMTNKRIPLGSTSWTLNSIRRMWRELNNVVAEQGEFEISRWAKPADQSEEEFEASKSAARHYVFKILGTVEFDDDNAVHDVDPEIVKVEDEGPRIRFIYLSNLTPYQREFGEKPDHAFELIIDLRNPSLFDATSVLSAPTPNDTHLAISGTRSGWQGGIEAVVKRSIPRKRPIRSWFHGPMVYDLFLFVVAIPLALYACWALEPFVDLTFGSTSSVVVGAAYLYIGFSVLWIYRFMFSYAKWAFPFTEISDQKSSPARHRALWWALFAVIVYKPLTGLVGEFWKWTFGSIG